MGIWLQERNSRPVLWGRKWTGRSFTLRLALFNHEFTMRAMLLIFPLSSHNFILSPLNYSSSVLITLHPSLPSLLSPFTYSRKNAAESSSNLILCGYFPVITSFLKYFHSFSLFMPLKNSISSHIVRCYSFNSICKQSSQTCFSTSLTKMNCYNKS